MMMYKLKADETNRSVRKTNTEYENTWFKFVIASHKYPNIRLLCLSLYFQLNIALVSTTWILQE